MHMTNSNQALGPTPPACQMAADATAHMTESQRLALAIQLINGATQPASIPTLRRISQLAGTTGQQIEASRMVDAIPATSSVDPAFMRVFLKHFNTPKGTSFQQAYRHACLDVTQNKLTCCASSQTAVRHALTAYNTNQKGNA